MKKCNSSGNFEYDDCNDLGCENNACKQLKGIGETCSERSECQSNWCDGTCKVKPAGKENGEICAAHTSCMSQYCDYKTFKCDDKPSGKLNGEACEQGTECASGSCFYKICTGDSQYGEKCLVQADCEQGVCLSQDNKCHMSLGLDCNNQADCDQYDTSYSCDTYGKICRVDNPCKNKSCSSGHCEMGMCVGGTNNPKVDHCKEGKAHHFVNAMGNNIENIIECQSDAYCSMYKEGNTQVAGCVKKSKISSCSMRYMYEDKADTLKICDATDSSKYYDTVCKLDLNGMYVPFRTVKDASACPSTQTCQEKDQSYDSECK